MNTNIKDTLVVTFNFMWRFALISFSYGLIVYFLPWIAINIIVLEIIASIVTFYWMLESDIISYRSKDTRRQINRIHKQMEVDREYLP